MNYIAQTYKSTDELETRANEMFAQGYKICQVSCTSFGTFLVVYEKQ